MQEILYQFNPWWEGKFETNTIKRELYLKKLKNELESKEITFIIGLRRVGKTTIIYQLIEDMLKDVDYKKILYLSLDHPAFDKNTLLDILKEYRTIHKLGIKEKVFLFFDEVHIKKDFERELKILYDIENVKIFASGSSSLVIKHKSSFLVGRYNKILVEPLNFDEFLKFKNIKIQQSEIYLLDRYLEDYLVIGGIPEYVLKNNPEYVLELVEGIIYKDVVGKYGVKNPDVIKKLFLLLIERVGNRFTFNKIAKILDISIDTVRQYITYLEETFLLYTILKYSKSMNERIYAPKKMYVADNGIKTVLTGFKNGGILAENLVFLNIKNKGEIFYYFHDGKEVDFVIGDKAIEVKYKDEINEEDLKQIKSIKIKNKILVSKKTASKNSVEIMPLIEFLKL
ncbi:ATP-binding protein [Candidatus Woesearchaeota archaeon]|nr:ATP-binding protein [Candidatus Woesearchaeota archaeon]